MPKKLTQNAFIKKAKKVHNNKYDYSLVNYINGYTKVDILCPQHGLFKQRAKNHTDGQGCFVCAVNKRKKLFTKNIDSVLKNFRKTHKDKYEYNFENYENAHSYIEILCYEHGLFKQQVNVHQQGAGCPQCGIKTAHKKTKLTQKQFEKKANKIHHNKYDYSITIYDGGRKRINLICKKHGKFTQKANDHLNGYGCKQCAYDKTKHVRISDGQKQIYNVIKQHFNDAILEKHIKINENKFVYVDIYVPSEKLVIEYHGDYWHCNPRKYKADYFHKHKKMTAKQIWDLDENRKKELENKGCQVKIIWESEYKNIKYSLNNKKSDLLYKCI